MSETTNASGREIRPRANVEEARDGIRLTLEMPGAVRGTISVGIDDDLLTVRADRAVRGEDWKVHHRETEDGAWHRAFRLSRDLSRDGIEAGYEHGVLTVFVPRAEHTVPKKIEVKVN
jgi:HSP20 family protein